MERCRHLPNATVFFVLCPCTVASSKLNWEIGSRVCVLPCVFPGKYHAVYAVPGRHIGLFGVGTGASLLLLLAVLSHAPAGTSRCRLASPYVYPR